MSAMDVCRHLKGRVKLVAVSAGRQADQLWRQIVEFKPELAGITSEEGGAWLRAKMRRNPKIKTRLVSGSEALSAVATLRSADLVLTSVVGAAGLVPTLQAIEAGKDIALANKETLVAGGELVARAVKRKGVKLLPVDSEHNAIFQCLAGVESLSQVRRVILTASGGPFRQMPASQLKRVTLEQALKHPTWVMGAKITIDSATLMNKGLEVIEARWLFGVDFDRISVVVHPQSVIHSMVEAVDGSVLAQLGPTDMRLPIQHAFTWPDRAVPSAKHLDFLALKALTFEQPDMRRFPCLAYAYEAGRRGGTAPAALNAANEVAVGAFLAGKLDFLGIPRVIGEVLKRHRRRATARMTLQTVLETDAWARQEAREVMHA